MGSYGTPAVNTHDIDPDTAFDVEREHAEEQAFLEWCSDEGWDPKLFSSREMHNDWLKYCG